MPTKKSTQTPPALHAETLPTDFAPTQEQIDALARRLMPEILAFVISVSGALLNIVSVLGSLLAVAVFFLSDRTGGLAILILAFLISPAGLPALAAWAVGGLGSVYCTMRNFIFG